MLIAGLSGLQNALQANVGKSRGMLWVGSNGRECSGLGGRECSGLSKREYFHNVRGMYNFTTTNVHCSRYPVDLSVRCRTIQSSGSGDFHIAKLHISEYLQCVLSQLNTMKNVCKDQCSKHL